MNIIFEAPLNQVSFGNVAYNILREFYKLNQIDPSFKVAFFPISNPDLSAFSEKNNDLHKWIKSLVDNRYINLTKDAVSLKLWHINGAEKRISAKQILFSFYELDQPTNAEKSLVGLQNATIFSSSYAAENFKNSMQRADNIYSIPLGFDEDFYQTNRKYLQGKIHFLLMGKLEKRKHTDRIIKLWAKRFGKDPRFQLSCSILNPFIDKEVMKKLLIGYKSLAPNINILPYVGSNLEVNDILNSADIDLSGLSGAEGWGLPAFNATCLGKWSLVLNATSHTDWANENNCLLIKPSNKIEAYDGVFFKKGADFNQGMIYDFDDEEVVYKMETAITMVEAGRKNDYGIELGKKLTYGNTVSQIVPILEKVAGGSL